MKLIVQVQVPDGMKPAEAVRESIRLAGRLGAKVKIGMGGAGFTVDVDSDEAEVLATVERGIAENTLGLAQHLR